MPNIKKRKISTLLFVIRCHHSNRSLCNITTRVPMPLVKHVNREEFQYIVNYLFVMLGYPELRRTTLELWLLGLFVCNNNTTMGECKFSFWNTDRSAQLEGVCGDVFIYAWKIWYQYNIWHKMIELSTAFYICKSNTMEITDF